MWMVGKTTVFTVGELIQTGYLMIGDGAWNSDLKSVPRYWFNAAEDKYAVSYHQNSARYTETGEYRGETQDRYRMAIELGLGDIPEDIRPPEKKNVPVKAKSSK